jgi:hypothetical protein
LLLVDRVSESHTRSRFCCMTEQPRTPESTRSDLALAVMPRTRQPTLSCQRLAWMFTRSVFPSSVSRQISRHESFIRPTILRTKWVRPEHLLIFGTFSRMCRIALSSAWLNPNLLGQI